MEKNTVVLKTQTGRLRERCTCLDLRGTCFQTGTKASLLVLLAQCELSSIPGQGMVGVVESRELVRDSDKDPRFLCHTIPVKFIKFYKFTR